MSLFRDQLRMHRLQRMRQNLQQAQRRHAAETCPCAACVLRRAIADGSVEVAFISGDDLQAAAPAADVGSTKH